MERQDRDFLEALGGGLSEGSEWRYLKRQGRVLVVFPSSKQGARSARQLYSPQRLRAKFYTDTVLGFPLIWKTLTGFSWMMQKDTPLVVSTKKFGISVDAILLGNPTHEGRRALVLGDRKVVKVGVGAEAKRLVEREYDFLKGVARRDGVYPSLFGACQGDDWSSFAIPFYQNGEISEEGVVNLAMGWLAELKQPIEGLAGWEKLSKAPLSIAGDVMKRCAGLELRPSLSHGDLAPWNVRARENGSPVLIDWEEGKLNAVPGWDIIHFLFQKLALVEKKSSAEIFAEVSAFLASTKMENYLRRSGWKGEEQLLFLSYLIAMATEDAHITAILERLQNSPY